MSSSRPQNLPAALETAYTKAPSRLPTKPTSLLKSARWNCYYYSRLKRIFPDPGRSTVVQFQRSPANCCWHSATPWRAPLLTASITSGWAWQIRRWLRVKPETKNHLSRLTVSVLLSMIISPGMKSHKTADRWPVPTVLIWERYLKSNKLCPAAPLFTPPTHHHVAQVSCSNANTNRATRKADISDRSEVTE